MNDLFKLAKSLRILRDEFDPWYQEDRFKSFSLKPIDNFVKETEHEFNISIPVLEDGCEVKSEVKNGCLIIEQQSKDKTTKTFQKLSIPKRFGIEDGSIKLPIKDGKLTLRLIDFNSYPNEPAEECCLDQKKSLQEKLKTYEALMQAACHEFDIDAVKRYMEKAQQIKAELDAMGECKCQQEPSRHEKSHTCDMIKSNNWKTRKKGRTIFIEGD